MVGPQCLQMTPLTASNNVVQLRGPVVTIDLGDASGAMVNIGPRQAAPTARSAIFTNGYACGT